MNELEVDQKTEGLALLDEARKEYLELSHKMDYLITEQESIERDLSETHDRLVVLEQIWGDDIVLTNVEEPTW